MDWKAALSELKGSPDLRADEVADNAVDSADEKCATVQVGKLVVSMERKGRAGKTATIVSGFTLPDSEVARIAAKLKKRLGTGGSARGGEILVQGDRREAVTQALRDLGFKV